MKRSILNWFWMAAGKFPKYFLISMLLSIFLAVMNALLPWGLRIFLQQIDEQGDYRAIAAGILFFVLFFLVRIFLNMAWFVSLDCFGGKYIEDLTLKLERAMSETSYDRIEHLQPGVLRNIMYTDVLNIFRCIGHHVPSILGSIAVMMAAVFVSLGYEVKYTLFICAAVAVGLGISWCSRKILARISGKTNGMLKKHDAWCTQFISMLPVIQQNPVEEYYMAKTSENLSAFIKTAIHEDTWSTFWTGLVNGYHSLFSIALSALLALPVAGNSISNLVFFTMIANLILEQAQSAEQLFQQTVKMQISFLNVEKVLELPKTGGEKSTDRIREVKFEHVVFSYSEQASALKDICCQMQKGDIILLQGKNGSGKSTFLKILTGAYLPTEGSVSFNHLVSSELDRRKLNRRILYISQEEKCLNETFKVYLEKITGNRIEDTYYRELLQFVELPDDGRKIRENGLSLSVGQRKKLLIMKMFLRFEQSDIIILDELTAGLDAQTSKKIYSRLFQMAGQKNKIVLVVDHTETSMEKYSKIFYFSHGTLKVCEKTL